jgi:hypothetical protein
MRCLGIATIQNVARKEKLVAAMYVIGTPLATANRDVLRGIVSLAPRCRRSESDAFIDRVANVFSSADL